MHEARLEIGSLACIGESQHFAVDGDTLFGQNLTQYGAEILRGIIDWQPSSSGLSVLEDASVTLDDPASRAARYARRVFLGCLHGACAVVDFEVLRTGNHRYVGGLFRD